MPIDSPLSFGRVHLTFSRKSHSYHQVGELVTSSALHPWYKTLGPWDIGTSVTVAHQNFPRWSDALPSHSSSCPPGTPLPIAHAILAGILGHAIFAIAHPDTYLPTLRSSAFAPVYGIPIVVAAVLVLIVSVVGIVYLVSSETELLTISMLNLLETVLPIPAGVVIQILGVSLLRTNGFHGPLPNTTQAARIGAGGHALLIGIHAWRFNRRGSA
ncbi:hypothetical protein FB451DRAFT_1188447 [Mycena latifolia]|nr:hypothetical protein FB451DRAFT_1188447 [Mycena latifolia]